MSDYTTHDETPVPVPKADIRPTVASQAITWPPLFAMAQELAPSNLVPKAYRGRSTDIAVAGLRGQEVGLGLMSALDYIVVIEGKPSISAEGSTALVRRAGHSITGEVDDEQATVTGKRCDTGDTMTVTWSLDDATRAGLLNKSVWRQYPRSMLWARAVSQLCRMLFPDVLMGLSYTPEEVESFSGGVVEVEEATVPEGFSTLAEAHNEHQRVADLIKALPDTVDREPFHAYRQAHGWPMTRDALVALGAMAVEIPLPPLESSVADDKEVARLRRQVMARARELNLDDGERHALISYATNGYADSVKGLGADEFGRVLEVMAEYAAGRLAMQELDDGTIVAVPSGTEAESS